jgi:hypothetical protein
LEITALDEPHVDIELTVDFAVMVNGYDVRVVQTSGGVSFPAKSVFKFLVAR